MKQEKQHQRKKRRRIRDGKEQFYQTLDVDDSTRSLIRFYREVKMGYKCD